MADADDQNVIVRDVKQGSLVDRRWVRLLYPDRRDAETSDLNMEERGLFYFIIILTYSWMDPGIHLKGSPRRSFRQSGIFRTRTP